MNDTKQQDGELYEVFMRSRNGIAHQHCGSLHAVDDEAAMQYARDIYARRNEGVSIWVVQSKAIFAMHPNQSEELLSSAKNKIYRHPSFYQIPEHVKGL